MGNETVGGAGTGQAAMQIRRATRPWFLWAVQEKCWGIESDSGSGSWNGSAIWECVNGSDYGIAMGSVLENESGRSCLNGSDSWIFSWMLQ